MEEELCNLYHSFEYALTKIGTKTLCPNKKVWMNVEMFMIVNDCFLTEIFQHTRK